MDKSELCFLSAAELAPLIRTRAVSPVEIVESFLKRIDTLNDHLRAYLYVAAIRRSPPHGLPKSISPLAAIAGLCTVSPLPTKTSMTSRGMPTTAASKVMAGYVAGEDCTVAARLRRAGAICLGKLNTHEFASGSMEVFGTRAQSVEHRDGAGRLEFGFGHSPGGASGHLRHRQ